MKTYRIVNDFYAGYEVQVLKRIFFIKYWKQLKKFSSINKFKTIEEAKKWVVEGCIKEKKYVEIFNN